ncbi:hypothetical protein [Actinopolymorpha sp. B9G3]|uniref:hypothetical protein n=1 Tax=Actinopolymorpha sp. B9G3 TaxID=3158970 RepID=UPI0032D95869
MNHRPLRFLGWAGLGVGGLVSVAGVAMLMTPGPAALVLFFGLVVAVAGGVLVGVARGRRRVPHRPEEP